MQTGRSSYPCITPGNTTNNYSLTTQWYSFRYDFHNIVCISIYKENNFTHFSGVGGLEIRLQRHVGKRHLH